MNDVFVKCIENTGCLTEYCYNAVYRADERGVIRIPEGPHQENHIRKLHIDGYRVINDTTWLLKYGYIKGTVNEIIEKKIEEGEIVQKKEELVVIKKEEKQIPRIKKRYGSGRLCEHRHDDGSQCKAIPLKGKKFCRHHLPKDLVAKTKPVTKLRGRPKKYKNPRIDDDIPF